MVTFSEREPNKVFVPEFNPLLKKKGIITIQVSTKTLISS
jgi:hypothetical protein